jgi:hypothetical protein
MMVGSGDLKRFRIILPYNVKNPTHFIFHLLSSFNSQLPCALLYEFIFKFTTTLFFFSSKNRKIVSIVAKLKPTLQVHYYFCFSLLSQLGLCRTHCESRIAMSLE